MQGSCCFLAGLDGVTVVILVLNNFLFKIILK
jgi:hypothetical protein